MSNFDKQTHAISQLTNASGRRVGVTGLWAGSDSDGRAGTKVAGVHVCALRVWSSALQELGWVGTCVRGCARCMRMDMGLRMCAGAKGMCMCVDMSGA